MPADSIRPARRQGGGPRHEEASNHGKERRREAARGGTGASRFLEEGWAHGSDSIDFTAMNNEELVFVDTATKCGGHGMPKEEPDQERFERIAAAYLLHSRLLYDVN